MMVSSVCLIDRGLSHGGAMLDTLILSSCNGEYEPSVHWEVSWRASASMADGAGGDKAIPSEMLSALTADTLVDWMIGNIPQEQADFSAFRKDERVISWCAAVRQLYSSRESGTD